MDCLNTTTLVSSMPPQERNLLLESYAGSIPLTVQYHFGLMDQDQDQVFAFTKKDNAQ